ncbi:hypothetical protein SAMN05216257_10452 [Meinhardsimonia xiamenensis]|jgi:hypothetical protein|uniref:LPS sulfotransferase NodH n=1 Tax=Meinhardsimonia xiamenensis TaxID=990712 RepID=A0A1G9DWG9_9RHOB|nr:nodulation protein NodH [Meinhardsimonia xiamenensis]PRX31168.1 hypothetical protein LV81_02675 [Meinhardsimonia xiamenensis]SDK68198.1 hypothetical protein SAMN05216257_10452 [Meinhardsimonia xiamenensis]
MSGRFDYFILLAEMRTGSNFLEENINTYPGLHCYGELFNPHFIGHARQTELLGVDLASRERDPLALLARIREKTGGVPGFRFFHDHDPRILDHCLNDPRCAKVVLTRNPLDSYISLKIASQTGQWRLNDMKFAKSAKVRFDGAEFEAHLNRLQEFQLRVQRALQVTGQTAFYIGYDDLQDVEVLNGLARFLGSEGERRQIAHITKVQNPGGFEEKVTNFGEMQAVLARIDRFDLSRTPNFEPRRGPAVPGWVAAARTPVIYMPVRSGVEAAVERWLAALDGEDVAGLQRNFTQKTLRQWWRRVGAHRGFTVLRHPVERLWWAFAALILPEDVPQFAEIRETLRTVYNVPIPKSLPPEGIGREEARAGFLGFARFVRGNLGGQTSIRVDPHWASQDMVLQGFARFASPDMILREETIEQGLAQLCAQLGVECPAWQPAAEPSGVPPLAEIYDGEIEAATRAIYRRDYLAFGFADWTPRG